LYTVAHHDEGADAMTEPWTQTYTGRAFTPLAPRASDVCLADIAHHLGMQCRFNGACSYHYSVAQHSIYVSRAVPPELARYGLIHDAAEAYLGDIVRPIKPLLTAYGPMENAVMAAICAAVGLPWPWPTAVKRAVQEADNVVLAAEAAQIMAPPPQPWMALPPPPRWLTIEEWSPRYAAGEMHTYLHAHFPALMPKNNS